MRTTPIAAFINDNDDNPITRVVATQSQLPVYSRDHATVHQNPSSINGGGTSLLHSGNNSLPALTRTGTYTSSRSVSSSIGNRVLPVRILEQHPQQPLSVPPQPGLTTYECPFNYLHCLLTFSNFIDWYSHSLTHFDGVGPPSTANCCFCDNKFQASTGEECWRYRMEHVDLHHKWGHRLSHARPDFAMFHYLWSKNIVDTATYKDLNGSLPGTGTQETPTSSRNVGSGASVRSSSPTELDESANVFTLNHDPGKQDRQRKRQQGTRRTQ